jgi:hypothetical protein
VRISTGTATAALVVVTCSGAGACGGGNSPPAAGAPPGSDRTATTAALETGASVLQARAPVEQIAMYLDGFHVAKDDPAAQMEAHHYCNQVNEDFAQCVLFDGNTAEARLSGIEYIISERLYATLPREEKAYWHPHNYEILSGQLRMPGLPDAAEKKALERKINSYGKTWHVWMTGMHGGGGDPLPFGPARLQWSFNRDGEAAADMVASRDARLSLDTAAARKARADLAALARPQGGVNAMAPLFGQAGGAPPGVTDNGDAAAAPVPVLSLGEAPRPPSSP